MFLQNLIKSFAQKNRFLVGEFIRIFKSLHKTPPIQSEDITLKSWFFNFFLEILLCSESLILNLISFRMFLIICMHFLYIIIVSFFLGKAVCWRIFLWMCRKNSFFCCYRQECDSWQVIFDSILSIILMLVYLLSAKMIYTKQIEIIK